MPLDPSDQAAADPFATARPFTILAVCTGNICRSPAVERLLVAALDPDSGVRVTSAGVRAVVGAPMPAPMAALVRAAGADPDGFAARQLTEPMLRDADLVLALTKWHRAQIVSLYPGAVRRTFTVRELARLVSSVDPASLPDAGAGARLAALLPLAAAQRGVRRVAAGDDDVVDPYGRSDETYQRSFDELAPAVAEIVRVVRG
ncbi:arsenate reductase/protein-tyrosine-phosphatase family protein [Pengzhenrongella sicca]|uniref:arsenate reductase/protein-tyrosine-phosphatase family protein n=1 Tax=Pengzhenrongella sicca TaxID=2819238 RepID=UPI001D0C633A|nr:low molecular weight phosphatase family protein [Pengzhenrongella sicca]